MEQSDTKESKVAGHHNDIAMGKVNHQQNAIYHCVTNGNHGVQAAQRNTVGHMLCKADGCHVSKSLKEIHSPPQK